MMASSPLLSMRNLSPIIWIVVVCYATNSIDSAEKIKNSYNMKHQATSDGSSNYHRYDHRLKMDHSPLTQMMFHQEQDHSSDTEQTDCPDGYADPGKGGHDLRDQMRSMLEHISDFLEQMMINSRHHHSREAYFMQDDHHFHQQKQQQDDNDCPMEEGLGEPHHQMIEQQEGFSSFDVPKKEGFSVMDQPPKQSHALEVLRDGRKLNERHKHLMEKFSLKPKLANQITEKTHIEVKELEQSPIDKQSQEHLNQVPVLDTTPTKDNNELDQQLLVHSSNSIDDGLKRDSLTIATESAIKSEDRSIEMPKSAFAVEHKYGSNGLDDMLKTGKGHNNYTESQAAISVRKSFKSAADVARHLNSANGIAETVLPEASNHSIKRSPPEASNMSTTAPPVAGEAKAKFLGLGQVEKSKIEEGSDEMQALLTCQFIDKGSKNVTISDVKWAKINMKNPQDFYGAAATDPVFDCPAGLTDCKVELISPRDWTITIHPRPPVQRYASDLAAPGYSISVHRLDDSHKGAYRCSARRQVMAAADGGVMKNGGNDEELVYRIILVE